MCKKASQSVGEDISNKDYRELLKVNKKKDEKWVEDLEQAFCTLAYANCLQIYEIVVNIISL